MLLAERLVLRLYGLVAVTDADRCRRKMSLGQEVHHQPIELVWALQWHHV
jgi:hypothetical protein